MIQRFFILILTIALYGDNNISINSKDGNNLLHKAVIDNNISMIKLLINKYDIDSTNYQGQTALHLSVIYNHIHIVNS